MPTELLRRLVCLRAPSRGMALARLIVGVFRSIAGFVVASGAASMHSPNEDEPVQYGVLNYRTGNLDNGLDPRGWYDFD